VRRYIIAIVLFVIVLAMPVAESTRAVLGPYLVDNNYAIDPENPNLELMAEDVEASVFLSGAEWHGTQASYDLQYAMLIGLHQMAGVNYFLLGEGYGTGQMYNMYLETGDPDLLDLIHEEIRFTNSSNHDHRVFWEKLFEYNQALPSEDRITVVGIDLEYQPNTARYYLSLLPGAEELPLLRDVRAGRGDIRDLISDIAANEDDYRNILGDDFKHLEFVLHNLTVTSGMDPSAPDFYQRREEAMYESFLRAHSHLPSGKYFGQITMEHIFQHKANTPRLGSTPTLAMLLNGEGSPVQGNVVSIAAMYVESEFRFYFGRYYTIDMEEDLLRDRGPFRDLAHNPYTLFRLNNEDSPFARDIFTIRHPYGGRTTDYFQYLLFIHGSEPAQRHTS